MTCSILSAIIAMTKVENWAWKPRCRIAAKDRFAGAGGGSATLGLIFNGHFSIGPPRLAPGADEASRCCFAFSREIAKRRARVATMQDCSFSAAPVGHLPRDPVPAVANRLRSDGKPAGVTVASAQILVGANTGSRFSRASTCCGSWRSTN